MRFVIQRVEQAAVRVEGEVVGEIGKGLLVLVGITHDDTREIADKMVRKLVNMRIFEDAQGKTNLSLADVNGQLLIISQFTLYADCRHGNRPSFTLAAKPEPAQALYAYILKKAGESVPQVQHGSFGAGMKVSLVNDGPFTIVLDSAQL